MKVSPIDYLAIVICALAWGTTWYAITLQFGHVDAIISLVYRFGLAAVLLFLYSLARGEPLRLNRPQHLAALGVGYFTFAIDYAFTYWAEERLVSAVVAVIFGALAFFNLITFRVVLKEKAPTSAWTAGALGVAGVVMLSWSELAQADLGSRTLLGLVFVFLAVIAATVGNVYAHRGEQAGAPLASSMAWAMLYGAAMLAIYAVVTGREWVFEANLRYIGSLLYLAIVGSVVAFLLYFSLARRRGYTTASYIMAITPLVAMIMSTIFENKSWTVSALGGVALVLLGQWLLLRTKKPSAA